MASSTLAAIQCCAHGRVSRLFGANVGSAGSWPRMVLNPIRIFQGSFGGPTLFQNEHFVSPNEFRREARKKAGSKYVSRILAKKSLEDRRPDVSYPVDPTDEVFQTS